MTTAATAAAPDRPEDYSAPKHTLAFRKRRFANWFPLGITYATFYMGRYNLNVAASTIMTRFSFTKEQFGIIATAGFWTYALSVIFNGPLADRYGGRKAILLAAVGAAALNGIIGLLFLSGWASKVLVGMSLLYAVNMYFQSFGALSIVKINAHWFHVRERGVFGGVFGIMISCGYFLAMTVGGWILAGMSWYWVFLIPSLAIAAMFVVDYFVAVDTPEDAGHPNIDTGDATSRLGAEKDTPVDFAYLVKNLYSNKIVVTITAAEFCTGFVRQGLMLWFVPFLKEVHGILPGSALFSMAGTGITVGGIIGGLLCGWMSDALFQSRRAPVAFLFYLGQIVSLLWLGHTHSAWTAAFLIGFSCMWIFGVHGMLSGTASMDFGGTKAAGTAAGLMDGVQYLASGLTGFLLGGLLDKYGWGVWTYAIIPFSAIGAVLMLTLWNATPKNTKITLAS
jgi:MFS transporter, OPA family, glycerol-3-phosphate transporter